MERDELAARHSVLYHVAAAESWPSIERHGLLSVERLLDLHGVDAITRAALLTRVRRRTHTLESSEGVAWVRDQKPLKFIERRLDPGATLEGFLEELSSRVFFHPTRERLERLLGAREYRGKPQVVLTVRTAELVRRHGPQIGLCRFNSGAVTQLNHPLRGPGSWLPIRDYPYDDFRRRYSAALVEVTVPHAVPDVLEMAEDVAFVTPPAG
ncbi:DUF7002 family protein [Nocardioides marmoraquaticus]